MNAKHNPFFQAGLALTAAVLLSVGNTYAAPAGAAFLKLDPSVRTFAMGGEHPVLNQGVQAANANPAGIARTPYDFEAMSTYGRIIGNTHYGYLAGMMQPWAGHYGAIQLTYTQTPGMQERDTLGTVTGTFSAFDYALGVSWGKVMLPGLQTGATLKVIQSGIAEYASQLALALDLGAEYETPFAQFGLSLRNLGTPLTFVHESDPLPMRVSLGAQKCFAPVTTVLSLQYDLQDEVFSLHAGAEYWVTDWAAFRLGYRVTPQENPALANNDFFIQALEGLSLGLGFQYHQIRLDYGVASSAVEWGYSHRVSLTVGWDSLAGHAAKPNTRAKGAKR